MTAVSFPFCGGVLVPGPARPVSHGDAPGRVSLPNSFASEKAGNAACSDNTLFIYYCLAILDFVNFVLNLAFI